MTEDVTMFQRIINRIAENSEANRQLRASDEAFKTKLSAALGDAAPEDSTDAAGFVAGVESVQSQLGASLMRNADLHTQRAAAYDAERDALKLVADLELPRQAVDCRGVEA